MKILNYIFWRFWKLRCKKENDIDSAYFFSTMFFGIFLIFTPSVITVKAVSNLPDLPESKIYQYLLVIPLVILCSFPFRFLFPKSVIYNLEFSEEEKKQNNRKILYGFLIVLLSFIFRFLQVKYL